MCEKNPNEIVDLNFATDDTINWFNSSTNPVQTIDDTLILRGSSATSIFSRSLGDVSPDNNRFTFKLNLQVARPLTGGFDKIKYAVEFWLGTTLIGAETITQANINIGEIVKLSIERTYAYKELSGPVSIRIKTLLGWQNEIQLQSLLVSDYNFCAENVRTYFVFDQLLEDAYEAESAALRLLQWKIGDVETITPDFILYNQVELGNKPAEDWNLAEADIDGANRVEWDALPVPNTFNPFVKEFGLLFDDGDYFEGKPTDTINGKDFGAGVMALGIDKPEILNADGINKRGAFFIDIDYTKNLLIEVDVVINSANESVYTDPTSLRKYFIIWDAAKKKTDFYFIDKLNDTGKTPQNQNGFLTGITEAKKEPVLIGCGATIGYDGIAGEQTIKFDIGTTPGTVTIDYTLTGDAVRFDAAIGNAKASTGYVGDPKDDQYLLNHGVVKNDIKTDGEMSGTFDIMSDGTKFLYLTITGILNNRWTVTVSCPVPTP